MKPNQLLIKLGAVAAFIEAAAYLIGFAFLILWLAPIEEGGMSSSEKLQFILSNKTLYQYWILIIYVLFGVALTFLVTALHHLLVASSTSSELISVGTVFGYVWVVLVIASGMITNIGLEVVAKQFSTQPQQAIVLWQTIETIQNGLGGGVEIMGGLWVFIFSLYALSIRQEGRIIHYLGLFVGVSGILTVIPNLSFLGAAFGLSQIIWFILIGIHLFKQSKKEENG